jgi:hypothetical protein
MTSTPMFREIARLPEFERDLKGPIKRFRTLDEDLATAFLRFPVCLSMNPECIRSRNSPAGP